MNIAAIYVRLSREDEDKIDGHIDSRGIENQVKTISDYCCNHQFDIFKIYSDDGYSGGNLKRPGFQQMLEDANNHKFNILLIKDLSRLGRNLHLVGNLVDKIFPQLGIRVIAINDNYDSSTYNDDESIVIKNFLNEYYLKDFKRKIHNSFNHRALKGKFSFSYPLYGFIFENGKTSIDHNASNIIKMIFEKFIDLKSTSKVAKELNDDNIPNRATYLNLLHANVHKFHGGSKWTSTMVKTILENEEYNGIIVNSKYGKIIKSVKIKDGLPKIIDDETFKKANDILSSQKKPRIKIKTLAKILYESTSMKTATYSLFEKSPRYVFKKPYYSLDANSIDKIVIKETRKAIIKSLSNIDIYKPLFCQKIFKNEIIDKKLIQKKLDTLYMEYKTIFEKLIDRKITQDNFDNKSNEIINGIKSFEDQLKEYDQYNEVVKLFENRFNKFLKNGEISFKDELDIVLLVIDKIIISFVGGTKKNKKIEMEIKFKFLETYKENVIDDLNIKQLVCI